MEVSEIRILVIALTCLFLLLGFFVFGFFLVYRKNQNAKENQIEKLHTELLQTQIEIQEQTLKTISQEIHDNIGQVLSLAKLYLNTLPPLADDAVTGKIKDTKSLLTKAIADLRNLSRSMYGDQLKELGLVQAITNELNILQKTGKYITTFDVSGDVYTLADKKELVLFRMVQEAINNSIKHAEGKNFIVKLTYGINTFSLHIIDDGKGFDVQSLAALKNGMGLKSMQNRALLIGGVFNIESSIEKGTRILFELADTDNK